MRRISILGASAGFALTLAAVGIVSAALLKDQKSILVATQLGEYMDADLKAGSIEYRIPWQYLPSVTPYNPKNGYAAFTLAMLLPDFRGAALDHDEFAKVGWHNQLTALFEFNRARTAPDQWIRENSFDGRSSSNEDADHIPGCKYYRTQLRLSFSDDMFVCDQKRASDRKIVILCAKSSKFPYPDCEVSTNINDHLAVDYAYSRIYFKKILEIDDRIRTIADAFVVPSK